MSHFALRQELQSEQIPVPVALSLSDHHLFIVAAFAPRQAHLTAEQIPLLSKNITWFAAPATRRFSHRREVAGAARETKTRALSHALATRVPVLFVASKTAVAGIA